MVGPNYARPQMPTPPQYRFVQEPAQAESLADAPWFQVFDDPTLQGLIREAIANNLDLRIAVARVEEARARAGIAKSYLYPQVDGVGRLRRAADVEPPRKRAGSGGGRRHDQPERRVRLPAVLGARSVRPHPARARRRRWPWCWRPSRAGAACSSRSSATWRRTTSCCASSTCSSRSRGRRCASTTRPSRTSRIGSTAACRTGSSSTASAPTARRPPQPIPQIEQQIALVENAISLLLGRLPGAVPREALAAGEAVPPPIPAGLPASLLERRPDVVQAEQLLVAANADIGVAKALFYPTISLTGFLGGVSGDSATFLGGDGAVWSFAAGLLQPVFQGEAPAPESRSRAGALRRRAGRLPEGGAQRLPRGRRLARRPSRSWPKCA